MELAPSGGQCTVPATPGQSTCPDGSAPSGGQCTVPATPGQSTCPDGAHLQAANVQFLLLQASLLVLMAANQ